ncbi:MULTISPECIES: formyltetrahydrofolate deformylase [Vitreoscilla]|uniref:Formyltetrahydrofolate deformylase n=1 Tax=Vitreoscilla stercoraria TaxID=61 RepID=A0ABY4E6H1_VITST|nr:MULTISPECIES: formyltetrahydrofolate deformylase [Vitreoscilla]AUZ05003.1 formyltetrahydrofolate deformylase [Vitreoscilla sp. C1]UOO91360.1 formyltetrahydrofolate deformylase [Vitreoscilla stercoraria]
MSQISFILNCSAPSQRGQVGALMQILEAHGAYIEAFSVFDDVSSGYFYMRSVFNIHRNELNLNQLHTDYQNFLRDQHAEGQIWDAHEPVKVLILGSKTDHCLQTLIGASKVGALHMDIVGIASNHEDLQPIAQYNDIPYFYLPVSDENRARQEQQLVDLKMQLEAEFVVLARYMQVLSPKTCRALNGQAINIHHAFLPGATTQTDKPYEQAHFRGVKLIGATAHYVTPDLDAGPIIEQGVERVDHAYLPADLLRSSRHIQSVVLERALQHVLERRVFINGERTIILR